jgi:hypothetical protein
MKICTQIEHRLTISILFFFTLGWPWYEAINPPKTHTDCALLFDVCTDNQPPGK